MSKKRQKLNRQLEQQKAGTAQQAKKKTAPIKPAGNFKNWWPGLLVAFITFIVFIPSLQLGFVNWDDPQNLYENENLKIFQYEWSWPAVKTIFSSHVIGNYNPLPIFTFALEKYFFASDPLANPFVFHFNNLWMHLATTFFVFIIILKLGLSKTAAFIGALLFGIHPMRVESVAWITERKDVLYGMFFMLALITYLNYVQHEKGKTKWYVLTALISILSYFSKVQAVTLPLSMVAIDFYLKRKWLSPKILILEKLPWWVLSLIFGLVNIYFLRENKSIDPDSSVLTYTFVDRLAVGAFSYVTYLAKWIYPYLMSPLYPYPKVLPAGAYIALAIVPVAVIAFLYRAFKNRKTTLLFGWAFFTFNIMFLLQILAAGQGFLADRFTYVAYFGLFFLAAAAFDWLAANKPDVKKFLYAGGGLYFILLIFLTNKQIKIWQNGGVLWEYVKGHFPNNALAWRNAAFYYRETEKNFPKATEYFTKSISLDSTDATVLNSLAKTYFDQCLSLPAQTPNYNAEKNRLAQMAIQTYVRASRADSLKGRKDKKATGEIEVNLGVAYALIGQLDQSVAQLTKGIAIDPANSNGYLNRSLIYINQGRYDLAEKDYDEYIKLNAFNPDVFYERGVCKMNLNRPKEALPDFDKAISLKTTQPLYFIQRSRCRRQLGNIAASRSDAQQAKKMGANVPPELLQ